MLLLLITLIDGSQINLKVDPAQTVQIDTAYGLVKVPWGDFREINVGVHVDDPALFKKRIADLGSEVYVDRVVAEKALKANYRQAYPFLVKAQDSDNFERSERAKKLIEKYGKFDLIDTATLKKGSFVGSVAHKHIVGDNECLGPTKLPLSQIVRVQVHMQKTVLNLPAGSAWTEVGFVSKQIHIIAAGQVDMYPTTPGYVYGPMGGGSTGAGGYPIGALIGRINGTTTFLVGADFSSSTLRGTLELKVNGAPEIWQPQVAPSGEFNVEVQ